MSSISIKTNQLSTSLEGLKDCGRSVNNLRNQLNDVCSNISAEYSSINSVKRSLGSIAVQLGNNGQNIALFSTSLAKIIRLYEDTEREIAGGSNVHKLSGATKNFNSSAAGEKKDTFWDQYKRTFKDNFWNDLRDSIIEGSGKFIVRTAGFINIFTATGRSAGKNAFVIVNPGVANTTRFMGNIGSKIVTGAKYGLPIIGGVIDFFVLKHDGQNTRDSAIKATAHVGIGLGGAEAGAAIGGAIGSVIPGAGTAAGAVIGFGAGVIISTLGDVTFDWFYDNHIKSHLDSRVNSMTGSTYTGFPLGSLVC